MLDLNYHKKQILGLHLLETKSQTSDLLKQLAEQLLTLQNARPVRAHNWDEERTGESLSRVSTCQITLQGFLGNAASTVQAAAGAALAFFNEKDAFFELPVFLGI